MGLCGDRDDQELVADGRQINVELHMHILARWAGDTNFMTTVGETRLEPEDLSTTYTKLRKALGF